MKREQLSSRVRCYLTPDEVENLIDHIENREWELAVRLMYWALARSESAANARVRGLMDHGNGVYSILLWAKNSDTDGPQKRPSRRVIPEALYEDLLDWCRDTNRSGDDYIFSVQPDRMRGWVKEAAEATCEGTGNPDYADVTSHDLRRSAANWLYRLGCGKTVIKEAGDWSDVDNIEPYLDSMPASVMHQRLTDAGWFGSGPGTPGERMAALKKRQQQLLKIIQQVAQALGIDVPESVAERLEPERDPRPSTLSQFGD